MPTTPNHSLRYPDGTDSALVPADMENLAEDVDDALDNIGLGQITGANAGELLIANSSGVVTGRSVSGDITVSDTGVTQIGNQKVGNAQVKNDAAIAHTKLASINAGRMLMGNGSNVPTATAMSGDATLSSSGVLTIGAGKVSADKLDLDTGQATNVSAINLTGSDKVIAQTASLAAGTYLVIATIVVVAGSVTISVLSGLTGLASQSFTDPEAEGKPATLAAVHTQGASVPFSLSARTSNGLGTVVSTQGRISAVRIG